MSTAPAYKPSLFARAHRVLTAFPFPAGDTVKRPDDIAALLTRMYSEAPIVSVTLGKTELTYSSSVLGISKDANRIWLDELTLEASAETPGVRASLTVSGCLDGATIRFTAPIAEIAERNGISCYGLARPRRVEHRQRRTHRRLSTREQIQVYLVDSGATLQHATLHDISLGGIAARVFSKTRLTLARGDYVPGCTVKLPRQTLQCALEARHVSHDEKADCWVFGARFVDLGRPSRIALNQFIASADAP